MHVISKIYKDAKNISISFGEVSINQLFCRNANSQRKLSINRYGRQPELDQLQDWILGDMPCRLIAINGPAGIGKTSLAIRLAKQLHRRFLT